MPRHCSSRSKPTTFLKGRREIKCSLQLPSDVQMGNGSITHISIPSDMQDGMQSVFFVDVGVFLIVLLLLVLISFKPSAFPCPPHLHREPQSPSLQWRKNTDFNSESSQSLSSDKVAAVGSGPHKDSSYSASHISQYLSWDAHGVQPGKEPLQISLYDTFKISIFLQTPIQGICCSTRRQLQRY